MPQVVPCEIHSNGGRIRKRSPGSQASKSTFNPEMPRNKTGPPPNLYELCLDRRFAHRFPREYPCDSAPSPPGLHISIESELVTQPVCRWCPEFWLSIAQQSAKVI